MAAGCCISTPGADHCYNWVGRERYNTDGSAPPVAGEHTVRTEFKYDVDVRNGHGVGKGGSVVLLAVDEVVGEGRYDNTCGYIFIT